jgi:hypothetical protein
MTICSGRASGTKPLKIWGPRLIRSAGRLYGEGCPHAETKLKEFALIRLLVRNEAIKPLGTY